MIKQESQNADNCRLSGTRWYSPDNFSVGLSGGSVVKNLPRRGREFSLWVEKISWSRKWQPTPMFLPGKSHGQRSLVGSSPWDRKSRTQLND